VLSSFLEVFPAPKIFGVALAYTSLGPLGREVPAYTRERARDYAYVIAKKFRFAPSARVLRDGPY
jgi:hypothetical protein